MPAFRRDWQHYTHVQIAARLGASTAAVHVAAERLRRVSLLDRDDEL